MAERQRIEIDYCSKCRGVWLDQGELDKTIERTNAELQTATPARQDGIRQDYGTRGKHGDGKHGYGKSRRRSVSYEHFDIFDRWCGDGANITLLAWSA